MLNQATKAKLLKLVSTAYKHVGRPIDRQLLKLTDGRYTVQFWQPMGALHTVGSKTGSKRSNWVLSIPDDDRFVIVASNFGRTSDPAWYRNLVANPDVRLSFRGRTTPFRARTTEGEERERLWQTKVTAQMPIFAVYEGTAAPRVIPVVVLEPLTSPETASS